MNNKIDGNSGAPPNSPRLPGATPVAGSMGTKDSGMSQLGQPSADAKRAPAAADSLSLTATATLFAELAAAIDSVPEVDSSRVEAVTQAIADGSYVTNSRNITDGILRAEEGL